MRFLCLCPTYNRPWRLLEESLACFHSQVHKDAFLLIYDDLGTFLEQRHANWALLSTTNREPGIVEKYNRMLELAQEFGPFDAIALWDDDDLYLPNHLHYHAEVLKDYELSYPSHVFSTYTGQRLIEPSGGRFWASLAIRSDAFLRTGGFVTTRRADFDQQSLAKWLHCCSYGDPNQFSKPTYVFRWKDTGCRHSQENMNNPSDERWYYANYVSPSRDQSQQCRLHFHQSLAPAVKKEP
jgi:glycosyltransferase involved in cell wall biosynthesis